MSLMVAVSLLALAPAIASAAPPASPSKGATSFVDTCKVDPAQPKVTLTGKVTDESGTPLQSAAVTLRCGAFRAEGRSAGDGTYSITAPAGSYQLDVDLPGLSPFSDMVQLSASGANQKTIALAPGQYGSIVTVSAPKGYVATTSVTATKIEAPLIEIPQMISIVTTDQMAVRNVQTVNEAIQYSGSVGVDTFGAETRYDWINIRGFDQSSYGLFRDNARWQAGGVSGQIDPYLLQEVDVVKGPSSVLFGQITPGGLVNLVTKRPPATPQNEVVLNYGSFSRKQAQLDLGGPVGDSGHVRYRLTGLVRQSDSQVDYVPDDRWFIASSVTYAPSSNTTWTLMGDFQHDKTGWSQFLPSQGTLTDNPNGQVRRSLFVGEPDYDYFKRDQWSVGSLFEHRFSDRWTYRNTARYSKIKYDGKTVFGGGLVLDKDGQPLDWRTLTRFAFGSTFDLNIFTMDNNLSYHVMSGNVEHNVMVGVDYSDSAQTTVSAFAGAPTLDIFNPVYGTETIGDLFTYLNSKQPYSLIGLYAQDHVKIGKKWVVSASARHDWTKQSTENRLGDSPADQKPEKTSGRIGFAYVSDAGVAPYVNYSTSFLPAAGVDFFNNPFVPITGKQVEGGIKFQPKFSNSIITASVYQITQDNVVEADPDHLFFQIQGRQIRSRGFEIEGVGSLSQGLNFHGAYSYLKQEVTSSSDPTVLGNRPPQVPKQLFSASLEYTFTSGPLSGLGISGGARFVGSSAGDYANTIEVPSYTLFDASARYLWNSFEFQLAANNLTDKTYVAVCQSSSYCNYGSARRIIASVHYRWRNW